MIYSRRKRPMRVSAPKPIDSAKVETDALRAENASLRAKVAELEALLSLATAPDESAAKSSSKSKPR